MAKRKSVVKCEHIGHGSSQGLYGVHVMFLRARGTREATVAGKSSPVKVFRRKWVQNPFIRFKATEKGLMMALVCTGTQQWTRRPLM